MMRSMYSGVAGLRSHQTRMDVIGNNIGNVNTVGFKSSRVIFKDVFYQTLSGAGAPGANKGGTNPLQIGYGSMVSSIDVMNTRAGMQMTDRPLDMYISGEGYFAVKDKAGATNFTRAGNFSIDSNGDLVDSSGNYVQGVMASGGVLGAAPTDMTGTTAISILDANSGTTPLSTYTSIAIGKDGVISGTDSTGAIVSIAQLTLAKFPNADGMTQEGNTYLQQTTNSGLPTPGFPGGSGTGALITGGLEMSNVDLSKEFTDMITTQRGFQANSRIITTSDEMLQELVNLKR